MKIFIVGINGKMGRMVAELAAETGIEVAGGLDQTPSACHKVFSRAESVDVDFDVIIDFSRPETLNEIISLSRIKNAPVVIATTGYSKAEEEQISQLSRQVAVFKTANMGLGINVLVRVLPQITAALQGYDIEIIEAHHNQKVDAPSGTAILLERAVEEGLNASPSLVYGRSGSSKRQPQEIGMHAIRAGTIVGEHTVLFAADDEIIEIKHTALSRRVFAGGALKAAAFIADKAAGLYTMQEMLS